MRFSRTPASLAHYNWQISLLDVLLGAAAPLVAMLLREVNYFERVDAESIVLYVLIATLATVFSASYFRIGQSANRFLSRHDVMPSLKTAAVASALTAVITFSISRLEMTPRSLPALHFLVLGALLLGSRAVMQERMRARYAATTPGPAVAGENVLLVGVNDFAALYLRMLDCMPGSNVRVCALLDDDGGLHGRLVCGRIIAGGLNNAAAIIAEYATHGVVVKRILIAHLDEGARRDAMNLLRPYCEANGVGIEYLVARLGLETSPDNQPAQEPAIRALNTMGQSARDMTSSGLSVSGQEASNWRSINLYWRTKRLIDVVGAGLALLIFAPAFGVVALLVMLDVGSPVVFWQERVGYLGHRINVHKFRTLRNPVGRHGRVLSDRERLSPIGRFLRGSRLDELPQLYDILMGEMTMIGPRPLLPVDLPGGDSMRAFVPPGLTGWAQVHGGKLVTAEEKNALDEWYVHHASLWVDLRILRLTALAPFRGDRRRERVLNMAMQSRREGQVLEQDPAHAQPWEQQQAPRPLLTKVETEAGGAASVEREGLVTTA